MPYLVCNLIKQYGAYNPHIYTFGLYLDYANSSYQYTPSEYRLFVLVSYLFQTLHLNFNLYQIMKIVLDSFVNVSYLIAVLIPFFYFIKASIYSPRSHHLQQMLKFSLSISIIFILIYQIRLLTIIYNRKVTEFENNIFDAKLKVLHYFAENILFSIICQTIAGLLGAFKNFKVHAISDQVAIQRTTRAYSYLRWIPLSLIIVQFWRDIQLFTFSMEIFMIAEYGAMIIMLVNFIYVIVKIIDEVDVCLMKDKAMVLHFLHKCWNLATKLTVSLILRLLSKMLYLAAMMGPETKRIVFINDVSNLFKVISTYMMLIDLIDILTLDYRGFEVMFDEKSGDKFFSFNEDDTNEKKNEAEITD